jgi:hypothetical protein
MAIWCHEKREKGNHLHDQQIRKKIHG